LWQTIDDETGKPKSVVSVYGEGKLVFGKILFTYNEEGAPDLTKGKDGSFSCNKGKLSKVKEGKEFLSYCNLVIIKDLEPGEKGKYSGGYITDPKKGKTYKAEMWREGDKLIVRGKWGPIGRNQTWLPLTAADLPAGIL